MIVPAVGDWRACSACRGTGSVWLEGGPSFGAKSGTIGARLPGETVRIGPFLDEAIVAWQTPRKPKPSTTFVRMIDPFDGSIGEPTPVRSTLGVHSVIDPKKPVDDDGSDEDDIIDPVLSRRVGALI